MEKKVSEIVSGFLKISPTTLHVEQKIDRKALGSSIVLHRMYAKLAESGINVDNYHSILTYGDLLARLGKKEIQTTISPAGVKEIKPDTVSLMNQELMPAGIGIDIERTDRFPVVEDYRSDQFYLMNFSQREIAYAIIQPSPVQTFAGLFAAKEAVIKADAAFRSLPFNEIEIQHNKEGKPFFDGIGLSISHTGEMAVAVAVHISKETFGTRSGLNQFFGITERKQQNGLLVWLALIISVMALLINYFK